MENLRNIKDQHTITGQLPDELPRIHSSSAINNEPISSKIKK
jgi:hypothetical protein